MLLVLASHFWAAVPHAAMTEFSASLNKLARYGETGVTLFFVLSGFLIGRSLMRRRGSRSFFGGFFLRRACRLLPLYGLLLGATLVAAQVLFALDGDLWEPGVAAYVPRWSHAVFMQNVFMALAGSVNCEWLNPTWSLAVQVQFYLLLPVVVWLIAPRWLPAVLVAGLVTCWAFRWAMHAHGLHAYLSLLTLPGRADGLLAGVLIACAWEQGSARAWLERQRRSVRYVALAAGAAFVLLAEGGGGAATATLFHIAQFTLLSVCFGGLIIEVLGHRQGRLTRWMRCRPLVFWGGISYCVYLAHQPVNSLVHAMLFHDWPQTTTLAGIAATLASVALVAGLGWLSQRWLERPLSAWARRITSARPPAADDTNLVPVGPVRPAMGWTTRAVMAVPRQRPAFSKSGIPETVAPQ